MAWVELPHPGRTAKLARVTDSQAGNRDREEYVSVRAWKTVLETFLTLFDTLPKSTTASGVKPLCACGHEQIAINIIVKALLPSGPSYRGFSMSKLA